MADSCAPEVDGNVISGGIIEVNKLGVHTKFRGSIAQPVREIWNRVQICNIYKMADCSRPEEDSRIEDGVEANLCANFGDPGSSGTFLFPPTRTPAHPPARPVRYDNTRSRSYASSSGKKSKGGI